MQARNGPIGTPTMPAAQVTSFIGITGCSAARVKAPNMVNQCCCISCCRVATQLAMTACTFALNRGLIAS